MSIREPRIPIYSNVTGEPFQGAADIAALLPRQLVEPVQWEGTIRKLVAAGGWRRRKGRGCSGRRWAGAGRDAQRWASGRQPLPGIMPSASSGHPSPRMVHAPSCCAGKNQMHELGPGQQIKAMVKRVDNAAWAALKNTAA